MPIAPKRQCSPGCPVLVERGKCPAHAPKRESAHKRGYTASWNRASKAFLARNPMCRECLKQNKYTPATETDHIVPHLGDYEKFWSESNWQPLCHSCHSTKTTKEDGGFGHTVQR